MLILMLIVIRPKHGGGTMNKALAEFLGTLTLVLLGCGAAVIAGKEVGVLGI